MAFALCLGVIAGAAPAYAQTATPERLEALEEQLETRTEEKERLAEEAAQRKREVASLRQRLIEAAESLQQMETRASAIESRLMTLTGDEAALTAKLYAERDTLAEVLAALQALELSQPPAIAVSPQDAAEAARTAMVLGSAAPELAERAEALRIDLDRLAALRADMETEKTALLQTNEELRGRQSILEELLFEKQKEETEASLKARQAQARVAALAAKATTLRGLIDRLEEQARRVAPRLKPAAPPPATAPSPGLKRPPANGAPEKDMPGIAAPAPYQPKMQFAEARGRLRAPVAGAVIERFGARRAGGGKTEGLRVATRGQAVVTAPFNGRIVFARAQKPIGNVLILDVGGGYHIILVGMDRFYAVESQDVITGEPIGVMGPERDIAGLFSAGSEAPELYVEIRKKGEPVDPARWLETNAFKRTAAIAPELR
ncbi:MAG: peptidoglycan DD-metalloendopeptidase family protein [Pseudomonadota bacterium]